MNTHALIPRQRLRWIPKPARFAHEYCFFLHDHCVALLKEYEEAEANLVGIEFKNKKEARAFSDAAKGDAIGVLRALGYHEEARRVAINAITMAMVSDCLHHVFEALRCLERRKFVVALNLLRKPLLDSLVFLSWVLGDEDGFYEAFTKQSPQALSGSNVGNRRPAILRAAHAKTSLGAAVEVAEIEAILFDADNVEGLYWLMQRAVHLITVQRVSVRTEAENFNFIFKSYADDDVYLGVYETLPTVLLYLTHVIAELFDRMRPMDEGSMTALRTRSTAGLHLVYDTDQVPEFQRQLASFAQHFPCGSCGAEPRFSRHNTARALLTESFRCHRCRRVNHFPFAWLF
ncbi:MAG: hypothetical protein JNL41_09965 [Phenylobacterium sp.]|nr:hypothetical protein [Phenylobacterium sp.]